MVNLTDTTDTAASQPRQHRERPQAKADCLLLMTHDRQFTCYREPWVVLV